MATPNNLQIVIRGAAPGLTSLEGLTFDPREPHTYCGICGEVYQTDMDRNPAKYANETFDHNVVLVRAYTEEKRRQWSHDHSNTHTPQQHHLLKLSGLHATPEAARKLAAFGIISITDAVLDPEVSEALRESSPIPTNDAEGS